MTAGPEPRIGDVERAAAADALGEHYAAGRLTREELDQRMEEVWTAKTDSDLAPLFADLPLPGGSRTASGPFSRPAAGRPPVADRSGPTPRRRSFPWVPLVLLVIGLSILLPGPWWLLFLGAVFFHISRGRSCQGTHGRARRP
jgi:hypothetical protein